MVKDGITAYTREYLFGHLHQAHEKLIEFGLCALDGSGDVAVEELLYLISKWLKGELIILNR